LGSVNANVFATGVLCVSASQRGYFPGILANLHVQSYPNEDSYYQATLPKQPTVIWNLVRKFARMTEKLRLEQNVPM
jgi:solute carrier family 7 (L-type amino acid transporter), member 6